MEKAKQAALAKQDGRPPKCSDHPPGAPPVTRADDIKARFQMEFSRPRTTTSSTDTDSDDEDEQTWHKSPLHVRRIKRRDRPLSGEIHYLPSQQQTTTGDSGSDTGGRSNRRVPRMGSPSLFKRDRPKPMRTPRRLSAPSMGSKSPSRKYGGSRGSPRENSTELVQVGSSHVRVVEINGDLVSCLG